ncbi:hypothetical protein A3A46_02885 [Candidatus Roizmanbacteria bacterium RIFCSPLOWO2_01_FULL_37_13]|uniref:Uncharacterized protein n=1 Tax=Candidatus Roizmanbacteria bacterium RIFCSPHIGHO2_02_FULL_38_11 TaxID=1802039 RepID=A0A1F7H3H8_9BACT|nr:MAG: hypothetical protein A3C25_00035 [Candidatus Roizmanbacteria bacterium RIFCSPHIGHO2_02_FULL_38_11]OGK43068.1 MAG: hypothetical protein A3A46_02885 [Candidatus Roizmanbacteria bacterium RIFCSPLOWO2_01_FULL_37_13]
MRLIGVTLLEIILGFIIFTVFLYNPSVRYFCRRQIEIKVYNYQQSVKKNGYFSIPQDEAYIQTLVPKMVRECLQAEGVDK